MRKNDNQKGGAVKEIADRDFEGKVLKCKLPVFACFTAEWCRSCYPTCLLAGELAERYGDRVKFVRMDIEESPEVSANYRVIVLPTILVFRNYQPVKKLVGFQDYKSLKRLLDNVTAAAEAPREPDDCLKLEGK